MPLRGVKEGVAVIAWWEVIVRLLLSALLGGVIGWERESTGKPAGLRTLMLAALGSTLFVLAGSQAAYAVGEMHDAVRAMAGIAQGVGFIGAGLIFRAQGSVKGLTTAAALWAVAALGLAVGLGQYLIAIVGAALIYVNLRCLPVVEQQWITPRRRTRQHREEDDDE